MSSSFDAVLGGAPQRVHLSLRLGVPLTWREIAVAGLAAAVLSALLSFVMGRDLNWDYFNYHGYAAFDVFGRRLGQDFLPASLQGYLNRLPFLPFALMDRAGWHSITIAAVLASLQSLNFLFLYLIAREFTGAALKPRVYAVAVTVLGAVSNVVLLQIGSTYVDPLTTVPVMAAVWIVLRHGELRMLALAGALTGAAMALKLTNAPFVPGILVAAALARGPQKVLPRLQATALGAVLGFVLLYGYWGLRLYAEYGSPFFPLFNNIFHAPDFPAQASSFQRFVPQTLGALLMLPFAMVEHRSWIYVESASPDLRPALLVCLALSAALLSLVRRARGRTALSAPAATAERHALNGMSLFFVVSLVGWLVTSTNGRYATPLLLLLGPLVFVAARSLMGARYAGMLCLGMIPLQVLLLVSIGNPRLGPHDWTSRWLPVPAMAASLTDAPYLFVSTSTSSESFVAEHVHPDSAFVNAIGQASIPNDGPGWSRFVAMRERFAGRTKLLFAFSGGEEAVASRVATMNGAIDRLGLIIRPGTCKTQRFNDDPSVITFPWNNGEVLEMYKTKRRQAHEQKTGRQQTPDEERLGVREVMFCDLDINPHPSPALAAARAQATEVMDAFERKCPHLLAPNGIAVEGSGRLWQRYYTKFDVSFIVSSEDGVVMYRMQQQAADVVLGNLRTWKADVERFVCRLPHDGAHDLSTLSSDARR